ncbi:PulJ/GspJ family protein [Cerasicoccus frondis]|uniref:PulJ/GspJ family protein n=1 Tax=Cerasicoccus frondis TaxID=490090 RepID=UPI002852AE9E|nr:type II secretion system protein [Cerasicoccus frondis]
MKQDFKARGFTLIEILAATGIMTVVILIVLSLTTNVLSVWNRSTGQLTANYEARVALDIMATDLETMVLRNRDFCWLDVRYERPTSTGITYTGALPTMPEFYFMARVEDRPRFSGASGTSPVYGDICAVGYKVLYQDPLTPTGGAYPMFGLYRFLIDSEHTFTDVMSAGSGVDLKTAMESGDGSGAEYYNQDGVATNVDSIDTTIASAENFLSANVVDLNVIFWYHDTNLDLILPLNGDWAANSSKTKGAVMTVESEGVDFTYTNQLNAEGAAIAAKGTLEFVDISVTVMSPEGMKIIQNNAANIDENWHELVAQYGQTFSRRVQIMAKPL